MEPATSSSSPSSSSTADGGANSILTDSSNKNLHSMISEESSLNEEFHLRQLSRVPGKTKKRKSPRNLSQNVKLIKFYLEIMRTAVPPRNHTVKSTSKELGCLPQAAICNPFNSGEGALLVFHPPGCLSWLTWQITFHRDWIEMHLQHWRSSSKVAKIDLWSMHCHVGSLFSFSPPL